MLSCGESHGNETGRNRTNWKEVGSLHGELLWEPDKIYRSSMTGRMNTSGYEEGGREMVEVP
jgi:hypothetical protein